MKSKTPARQLATFIALSFGAAQAAPQNGQFSWANLGTGDSDALVGLSAGKTYLENVNLLGGALTINSVPFTASTVNNPTGTGLGGTTWGLAGLTATFGGGGTNPAGTLGTLTNDFIYGGNPASLTLGNLTVGQNYILTFYCRSWEAAGARTQWLSASNGPSGIYYDEDYGATGQGSLGLLRYTFQATSPTQSVSIAPDVGGTTMHLYGFGTEHLTFDKSWTGGSDWTTATWSSAGAPNAQGANANFPTQGTPNAINLDANQTVGHLQFDGANAWTLAGANILTLQADAGAVSVLSVPTGTHTLSTAVTWSNDVMKTGAGTLVLAGPLTDNGRNLTITDGTLEIANAGSQTLAGIISGSGSLRKSGTGTLALSGRNTYGGQTTINSGTLQLQSGLRQGGTLLLADNFTTTGNPNNADLNYNLANRQIGALASRAWTPGGNVQVGNPTLVGQPPATGGDYLLLAGRTATLSGLPLSAATVSGPLSISFDMFKGTFADAGNWTSFAIRTTADGYPVAGSGELGFLYRKNTGIQIFNNGAAIANLASSAGGGSFSFYLTDVAGTGSPFAGNGTKVTVTQGGTVLGTYTLNTGMGTSYISFGANGGVGGVDNLVVGTAPVLPATTPVTIAASATLDLNGSFQQVASLADSGSVINSNATTPAILALSPASGSATFTGVIGGGAGALSLVKTGAGTQVLAGANTYAGVTTINAGTLQLGDGTGGHDGTLAGASIVDNATVAFNLAGSSSYAGVISGTGGLAKLGAGTLTLNGANAYTGTSAVNEGTLALGAGGSLGSNSNLSIAAGATFDVSAIASYSLGSGTTLIASGSTGGSAATLKGGTTVSLGGRPVTLNFAPASMLGDAAHPALNVSSGTLDLGSSTITINNNAATPLGVGDYLLITGGTVTGTPALNPVIGGAGLLAFTTTNLALTGGNLVLHVTSTLATTTIGIALAPAWTSGSTYGDALTFNVTVTGSSPGGTVTVKDGGIGGTVLGSAPLSGGVAGVTLSPLNLLLVGTHANIVAIYDGDTNNLGSVSVALPAQTIGQKTLTVSSPSAATKYYDGTALATLGGTLTGVVDGDTLAFGPGTFANAGPGAGIPVAFSVAGTPVANYTLTQPASATGNILAGAVWTGNALDTLWDTADNWLDLLAPGGANVSVSFASQDLTVDQTVELTSPRTVGKLTFGDTDPGTAAGWTLGNNITPANTLTLAGTSPTVTVNALGTDMAATISAVVAGTSGMSKAGTGTLVLTTASTYSGGTTINGGTLQLGSGGTTGTLGAGDVVNNATLALDYSTGTMCDLPNNVSGPGALHLVNGTLRVFAQGSTGTITIDPGGSLEIWVPGGAVTLPNDIVLNSMGAGQTRAGINQDGGGGLVTLAGQLTLAGDSRLGVGGLSWNNMLVSGKVTGSGKLYVVERYQATPATELRLTNAANDFAGGIEVEQGRLSVTQAAALSTGPITVTGPNSQLLFDEITATIPNNLTLGGGGNPTSTNYAYGNGTLVFHNDGHTATLSGTVTLAGDAKIRHYSAGGTTVFDTPLGGTGNLILEAGGAAVNHNQTWLFGGTGASTYGNTIIRSDGSANPIVRLNGGSLPATGTLTLTDGGGRDAVFDLNGQSQTVAGLSASVIGLGAFVTNTGATPSTLTVASTANTTFGGVIGINTTSATTGQTAGSEDIGLAKAGAGTLTLTGVNTYTGATAVNEGALLVGGFGAVGSVTIANAGFETPAVAGYLYTPSGASWTFNARSGICSNTFNPTAAPEGGRCAFIQATDAEVGSVSQTVTVGATASYTISFKAEGRDGAYGPCGVIVQVDGVTVGSWDATAVSQTQWQSYQAIVNLGAGPHTLTFLANNTLGGDRSLTIDDVKMGQTGVLGSLGNTAVTAASGATFGGIGPVAGAVTWAPGSKALFTVTPIAGTDNVSPMAIAGQMAFNGTEIHLNLPPNLPNGTYTLATSATTPVASGAFPAPVLASGSYVAGSSGVISLDAANKKLVLTVSAGNLYPTWAGVGGPAFTAPNGEGVANGLAWLLGAASPAATGTLGLLPAAAQSASGLTLHFKRVHDVGTAKLHLEYSTNLGTWNDPGVLVPADLDGTGTLGGDISYEATRGTPTDDIKLTIPASHAAAGRLFGRLTASEN